MSKREDDTVELNEEELGKVQGGGLTSDNLSVSDDGNESPDGVAGGTEPLAGVSWTTGGV